jgi:hypothetical protein
MPYAQLPTTNFEAQHSAVESWLPAIDWEQWVQAKPGESPNLCLNCEAVALEQVEEIETDSD